MRLLKTPNCPSSSTPQRTEGANFLALYIVLCMFASTNGFSAPPKAFKPRLLVSPTQQPNIDTFLLDNDNMRFKGDGTDYEVSQTLRGVDSCSMSGLDKLGITNPSTVYRNLSYRELYEHEVAKKEGLFVDTEFGPTFAVDTGKYTGRSPNDRFIVLNRGSETAENIDWNDINQPTSSQVFDDLFEKAVEYFNKLDELYVFDGYCGANPRIQRKVRFVTELVWQQHFCTNMFIRPQKSSELNEFEPDFTIINCCNQVDKEWKKHNLHSETAVVFDIEKKIAVIFGTSYGGEMKKGIFSLMNYWLPMDGQLSMHCSANLGHENGDTALFFGLSGTGKTTLSADPHRTLIGDDEHGWDDNGICNLEGGCYAKTMDLSEKTEPEIFHAIRPNAMLENVKIQPDGTPDYHDVTKTENGRVSYPVFHIPDYHKPQMGGHPKNIIFLSCDAFGVLPPVARLTAGQAMYHFMSGYTAKVAGTERGIKEPTATFSACFGAAFMTLHPTRYAELLRKKMEKHGSKVFLVNSGWSGGSYGVGERMSIKTTRACIDAILDGSINKAAFREDPNFGFEVPQHVRGVDDHLLDPKTTWDKPVEYDETAAKLANMFRANFQKYEGVGSIDYTRYGPKASVREARNATMVYNV